MRQQIKVGILLAILSFCYSSVISFGQPEDRQYNIQNRNAIADIVDGNISKAISHFKDYQEEYPGDLESLFGLAVAYSVSNKIDSTFFYG